MNGCKSSKIRWCLAFLALSRILCNTILPIHGALVVDATQRGSNHEHLTRVKRFVLEGHRWPSKDLTYKISIYPTKFKDQKSKVDQVFKTAFNTWARVSALNFEARTEGNVNIDIQFVRDHHNHCAKGPLTATNKLLAHAFFPEPDNTKNRPIHFNDHFNWSLDIGSNNDNKSLLATALHEIGHTLGLAHSKVEQSKMFSIELGRQDLHQDDIAGVQVLYGDEISMKQFYSIQNRWFIDANLDLYDKAAASREECARYALKTGYNLTIYDRIARKCSVKKDFDHINLTSYLPTGLGVTAQVGPDGYEKETTNFMTTVENWIAAGECDLITKIALNDDEDDHYICRQYEQKDCCTILFRLVEARAQESIL